MTVNTPFATVDTANSASDPAVFLEVSPKSGQGWTESEKKGFWQSLVIVWKDLALYMSCSTCPLTLFGVRRSALEISTLGMNNWNLLQSLLTGLSKFMSHNRHETRLPMVHRNTIKLEGLKLKERKIEAFLHFLLFLLLFVCKAQQSRWLLIISFFSFSLEC